MTYARSRLWLGIAGVGTIVLLSCAALYGQWPQRAFGGLPDTLGSDARALAIVCALYILIGSPFDFLGGYWLPCRHQRLCQPVPLYCFRWLRAVAVQGAVMVGIGTALLAVGRLAGRWGAWAVVLAIMGVLLLAQETLARLVGGLRTVEADLTAVTEVVGRLRTALPPISLLEGEDPSFVGGWVGLPGRERLVLPSVWLKAVPPEALAVQVVRRVGVLQTGARQRGVAVAVAWNLAGFALASVAPGAGVVTVAGLVTLSLWFTLWSFVGLLLLPSVSRPGVFEADRFAVEEGTSNAAVQRTIQEMDSWQDDEPRRPPLVETVFHPIPSVSNRLARLAAPGQRPWGAWHAARVSLYLSWAGLGLLSRAVHCNAGRPQLWVLFPGD